MTCTPHIRFKTERPERLEGPEEPERPEDPETPETPEKPEKPDAPAAVSGDTIRFAPISDEPKKEPERPAVWTYQGEPDPAPPASDPKEAREQARAECRE